MKELLPSHPEEKPSEGLVPDMPQPVSQVLFAGLGFSRYENVNGDQPRPWGPLRSWELEWDIRCCHKLRDLSTPNPLEPRFLLS